MLKINFLNKGDLMRLPKVNIIILNWNGKKDTIECLDSLKKITYPNYEITLVDNGSTDGSVECLKKLYPKIEIIENQKNFGFAEGNNIGIKKAIIKRTDYVLLLNNDTIVEKEFLDKLIQVAESDPNIGIVGPTIYYYNDVNKIQSAGTKISLKTGTIKTFRLNKNDLGEYNNITDVDSVTGCALLAKSELFENIGYLIKEYFAYWEETEWCIRARKKGYKVMYVPQAKVWHKGGSSSKKISGFHEYHTARNMLWCVRRHATKNQYILFLLYFFGYKIWVLTVYLCIRGGIKEVRSRLKGTIDGFTTFH